VASDTVLSLNEWCHPLARGIPADEDTRASEIRAQSPYDTTAVFIIDVHDHRE